MKYLFSEKRYISLKEASKLSGYHPDYLSSLIREGKIKGEKIGRNWLTTEKAVKNYLWKKRFHSVKDLFGYLKFRTWMIVAVILLMVVSSVVLFNQSKPESQRVGGDFSQPEMASESYGLDTVSGTREITATTYASDDAGGVEISLTPQNVFEEEESENFFQRIISNLTNNF